MNSDFIVAVHALVFLHHNQTTLSSEALSENICTNPVRVRRFLSKLCKAVLLEGKRGTDYGGYCYQKTKTITLKEVSDVFGGRFVEYNWTSGKLEAVCPICSGMAGYIDEVYGELNRQCANYLETVTIAAIEQNLTTENSKSVEDEGRNHENEKL